MPLDVPTAILQRRSIKNFKPDPIAPELLRQLLELTVAAPSSYNIQDWRIIIVADPDQKAALGCHLSLMYRSIGSIVLIKVKIFFFIAPIYQQKSGLLIYSLFPIPYSLFPNL